MTERILNLLIVLLLAGCTVPVGTINEAGTGYAINKEACIKYGLDCDTVELHEQYHLAGYGHCKNRACIMFKVLYRGEVKTWICKECIISTLWRR